MKNKFEIITILFLAFFVVTSCEKEHLPMPVAPTNVSFTSDVMPIFSASCSATGCHAAGANQPDLSSADAAFPSLTNFGYVTDSVVLENNILYQRLTSKSSPMPPSGLLSKSKLLIISTWITKGYRDN